MEPYRIFISHKDEDRDTAIAVSEAVGSFGDIEFFIAGNNINPGEDWRDRLRKELQVSDLLLLLFTAPTRHWDWCLYETGLFTRLKAEQDRPVVCIHDADGESPSPLLSLQAVPATVPDVTRFIDRLVRTTEITQRERPINANVTQERMESIAGELCERFSPGLDAYYATYRLHLDLPASAEAVDGVPDDATPTGTEGTMRLFGRVLPPESWGELVASRRDLGERWLAELDQAFAQACQGRVSTPTTQTFVAHDGAAILRPHLYRIDRVGTTPVAAVLLFTEVMAPSKVGGMLFNRLRIFERYHTEVFTAVDLDGDLPASEMDDTVEAFDLVREESHVHDVFNDESMREVFPDTEVRHRLRDIREEWRANADRLHRAAEDRERDAFVTAIRELRALSDAYRARVSARYADVLAVLDDRDDHPEADRPQTPRPDGGPDAAPDPEPDPAPDPDPDPGAEPAADPVVAPAADPEVAPAADPEVAPDADPDGESGRDFA